MGIHVPSWSVYCQGVSLSRLPKGFSMILAMPPRRARRPAIRSAFAIARLFLSLTCLSLSSLDGRRFYATLVHIRDILTHARSVLRTHNWSKKRKA
jgi:hypothetical protein